MRKRDRITQLETESTWLWQKVIESDRRYINALRATAEHKASLRAADALLDRLCESETQVDGDDEQWIYLKVQWSDYDRMVRRESRF